MLCDRIRGGFEESACLPTGNCSHHGSVGGGGWTKQDNKQGGAQVKRWCEEGEYMSKSTEGIQDRETFTRTKCTSTVVIYKYSSPSSFQLSENKRSKSREQLKDPVTQSSWRADTIEHIHRVAVSHCPLYLQDCTYTQVHSSPPRLLAWRLTTGRHTHATLSHTWKQGCV